MFMIPFIHLQYHGDFLRHFQPEGVQVGSNDDTQGTESMLFTRHQRQGSYLPTFPGFPHTDVKISLDWSQSPPPKKIYIEDCLKCNTAELIIYWSILYYALCLLKE